MPAQTVIQLRRDPYANWESTDPILASGEAGFDTTENKIKIGDGTTAWNSLDYASGGSGSITVSETAPAEPAEGDLWFNSTNALTYIYYDSFWVDLAPAIAGPTGATGATGEPGIVVQDEAPTETDVLWLDSDDPADAVAVPAGGTTGQVLAKATGDDYDTAWTTLPEAPTPPSGNAIINGAFDIWQRGTSFASQSILASGYTADRFHFYRDTGATGATMSRQASTLSGFQYAARLQRDSGNTSTAGINIRHTVETSNSLQFAGQSVTLSFYARAGANYSPTSSALAVALATGTGTDQAVYNFTGYTALVNATATLTTDWQRFTYTGSAASTATEIGIEIKATPTGTAGANDWFEITGVQIEVGSTATAFRRNANSIEGELAACQRYFYQFLSGNDKAIGIGVNINASTCGASINFPVAMRIAPVLIASSGTNFYCFERSSAQDFFNSLTINRPTETTAIIFNSTEVSGTSGVGGLMYSNNASASIAFSSEL